MKINTMSMKAIFKSILHQIDFEHFTQSIVMAWYVILINSPIYNLVSLKRPSKYSLCWTLQEIVSFYHYHPGAEILIFNIHTQTWTARMTTWDLSPSPGLVRTEPCHVRGGGRGRQRRVQWRHPDSEHQNVYVWSLLSPGAVLPQVVLLSREPPINQKMDLHVS